MALRKLLAPAAAALLLAAASLTAQDWAVPYNRFQQRVDLRELGYPLVNEIPENSSAITSLITARDGLIYGATCGESAYLFVFDPQLNKVRHLGKLPPSEQAVHHALVEGADGCLYLGSGLDPFRQFPLSPGGGDENTDVTLWNDIRNHFSGYAGGKLYRYDPKKSNGKVKLPQHDCELEELGLPLAHNSIQALCASPDGSRIYGLTYPDGHFFSFDLAGKATRDLGEIDSQVVFGGPERRWRSLPRALACDDRGRVFTTGNGGKIVYFDPAADSLLATELAIPMERYPAQFIEHYAVADCFARTPDGLIWGGSSDGYLFSLDPARMRLASHGKARADRRLRAITAGRDGKLYFMAGERKSTQPCQLFSYDPRAAAWERIGLLIVDRSPHYYWRGYQFDCMTTGGDGTIYLGESERKSHLFLYIP